MAALDSRVRMSLDSSSGSPGISKELPEQRKVRVTPAPSSREAASSLRRPHRPTKSMVMGWKNAWDEPKERR